MPRCCSHRGHPSGQRRRRLTLPATVPRSQQRLQATAWERLGDAGRGGNATQLSGEANVEAGFSSAAWQWKADAENAKGLGISLFDEPMGSCAAASIGRASISRATIATTPPESAARPAARSDREDVEQALVIVPALVGIGFAIGADRLVKTLATFSEVERDRRSGHGPWPGWRRRACRRDPDPRH